MHGLLLIVIPLIATPIVAVSRRPMLAWVITCGVCVAESVLALQMLAEVNTGTVIHYDLGGWAPPWGIEYRIDSLNALVAVIVTGIALLTLVYGKSSVEKEIPHYQIPLFYAAFLLCMLGLLGIALTGDIFNLFVFLEISSLASYALIAMGKNRKALTASFQYLVLGTLGATFFLIGVGLAYAATGTLNMADLAGRLPLDTHPQLVHTAFAFIIVGMALKGAIYPLHLWLPNAYSYAPSVISIFLSATATKVAIYVIIRCLFNVFSLDYVLTTFLPQILLALGAVAVVYGSLRAVAQSGMKKLLAYSSVAQIGYMIMGLGFASQTGVAASLIHLFNHALMKAALFMVAGIYIYRVNTATFENLKGLGKDMPWTFGIFIIAAFSLIGVPGTVGFISKWLLLEAAIEAGQWPMVVAIVIGSLLAIVYVWKLVEVLYFQRADKLRIGGVQAGSDNVSDTPAAMAVVGWLLAGGCLYFGIFTELPLNTVEHAVGQLFSVSGGRQ